VRQFAVEALGELGGERAGEAAVAACDDPDPWVRAEAVVALDRIGRSAAPTIETALDDDHHAVVRNAMVSLFKLRGEALCSVLLERTHADSERLREWGSHLLAGVDDERATSRLDAVANDETQSKVVRAPPSVRALDADPPGSSGGSSAAAPKTTARTYPARARSTADRTCEPLGSGIGDDTDTDTNTMTDPTADISDDAVDADETDETDEPNAQKSSADAVEVALRKVRDPEAGVSVFEAGVVEDVTVADETATITADLREFPRDAVERVSAAMVRAASDAPGVSRTRASSKSTRVGPRRAVVGDRDRGPGDRGREYEGRRREDDGRDDAGVRARSG